VTKKAAYKLPEFSLRPAAPPDEAFLLRIYANVRARELAGTDWDAAQRDAFLRQQFQARRADHRARFFGAEESIVVIEGTDAGVWMVWRNAAEIRLVNIELRPEQRGRGVGGALIRGLLREGKERRVPVTLGVRTDNLPAQRLYRRLGFIPRQTEAGYLRMEAPPGLV